GPGGSCASPRGDRVGHVDMLHVDLWYKGVNVLGDSGTYKYFVPDDPAMERYFKDIGAHNTIEIDGRGPLELASRFLWLPWPEARCLDHCPDRWQGEHLAYARPPWNVVHRRTVAVEDGRRWVITDELLGSGRHTVALRWHVADGPFALDAAARRMNIDLPCGRVSMNVEGPDGLSAAVRYGRSRPDPVCGWTSEYYGARAPRPTLEVAGALELPAKLVTRIDLDGNGSV
ncbi:MAG: heparinase II/III family protein, partial [Phycisphaerae bacterium]